MVSYKYLFICLTLLGLSKTVTAQKQKKVLFVIVDGISNDTKEKIPTPNLDAIAGAKGYARAHVGGDKGTYSQTPTISAVGYNSLLTGTWVNKHNVWDNNIKQPNYNYWTIFRYLQERYPWKKTAVFSTWIDNRTKLIGEGLPQTGALRLGYHFDGFELDTIRFPHDQDARYIQKIDELVVDQAASYLRNTAPDLSWVYLEFTDDMGHRYGDSDQFHDAVRAMDKQMGRLWASIKYREANFNEDWLVVITTDHGRDPKTGKGHGGQSDRERSTWIVTNAKKLNPVFTDNPGIVDIMPTIARHLDVSLTRNQQFEVDGIPFTGPVSATNLQVQKKGNQLEVSWKAVADGTANVWISKTNHYEKGGEDQYYLLGTIKLADNKATFDIGKDPSNLYKIVLEGNHNTLNKWIVVE